MQISVCVRTTGAVLLAGALSVADGQSFRSIQIPSSPTSYDQCTTLAREFEERANEIRARSRECMNEAADRWGNRACFKPIYDEDIRNGRESVEAQQECNQRARAYLEKQRQEEEARRQEADRRERELAREREMRERQIAERKEALRKAAELSEHKAEQKAELNSMVASANAGTKARALDTLTSAFLSDSEQNPFIDAKNLTSRQYSAARRLAGGSPSSAVVGAAVDVVLPPGEGVSASSDQTGANAAVGVLRSRGLASNPVAKEISGAAMGGITKIDQRALGQFDAAVQATADLGSNPFSASSAPSPVFHGTPIVGHGAADPAPLPVDQVATVDASSFDPATGSTVAVPAGYVLYRDPSSGTLSAVNYAQVAGSVAGGDQPNLGAQGCSTTGVGIVTPFCEKKRRAAVNPFAPR